MTRPSYPFPDLNPSGGRLLTMACYTTGQSESSDDFLRRHVVELHGDPEARRARLQYLTIEEELERAYRYVTPCGANTNAFSFKFAEVIRSAANAYEVFSKRVYARLYNGDDHLNVFNYLALDAYLGLSRMRVNHLLAADTFDGYPELTQPFVRLADWDGQSVVLPGHVPTWWGAYNAVKHETEFEGSATLAHATAVLAALFLMTEAVYGGGILTGGPVVYQMLARTVADDGTESFSHDLPPEWAMLQLPRWSRLFAHQAGPPPYLLGYDRKPRRQGKT